MSRIDETDWKVEKLLKIEDPLLKTSAQIAKMFKPYDVISKQMQDMNKLMQPIYDHIELTKKMTPDYWAKLDSAFESSIKAKKAFDSLNNDAVISSMNKIIKSLQTVEMQNTLKQLSKFESEFGAIVNAFDWNKIEFRENAVISYDGIDYNTEDIGTELEVQTKILENPSSGKEKRINAFKIIGVFLWILDLSFRIYTFAPQLPEYHEFWSEQLAYVQSIITGEYRIGYTIREQSYLRIEANGKAEIIKFLPYDTCVEIIDEIPRWYQVRYYDEENKEIIGWVSKLSIEK